MSEIDVRQFADWAKNHWESLTLAIVLFITALKVRAYWKRVVAAYHGFCGNHERELAEAHDKHSIRLSEISGSYQEHMAAIKQNHTDSETKIAGLSEEIERERTRSERLEAKVSWIKKRYKAAITERIWLKTPPPDAPPFLPLSELKTPIISVFNLKGGVGKTTLAANLAATYWNRGEKVLLIDLDYQASLTTLTLTTSQVEQLDSLKQVRSILELPSLRMAVVSAAVGNGVALSEETESAQSMEELFDSMTQRVSKSGYLFPTSESLDELEQRHLIEMAFDQQDVRFLLRRVLHSNWFISRFDRVIIDCPPRLTSGSVNSIAASHFVLVPILPDVLSTQAAPRLIKRLETFRQNKVCPHLKILGIVANKAKNSNGLSVKQKQRWNQLEKQVDGFHLFKSFIPERVSANVDSDGPFEVPSELRGNFNDLANEIDSRIKEHASF